MYIDLLLVWQVSITVLVLILMSRQSKYHREGREHKMVIEALAKALIQAKTGEDLEDDLIEIKMERKN
jgi:hypothetical protein